MTQHILQQDEQADIKALKNLAIFIGGFAVASLLLALGVTIFAP